MLACFSRAPTGSAFYSLCCPRSSSLSLTLSRARALARSLSRALSKLVGQRWRPRTLVLDADPQEDGSFGRLWWYTETDGPTRPKGCLPLEVGHRVSSTAACTAYARTRMVLARLCPWVLSSRLAH
jgi:hypothetical protein